jgi:hypothetical protein
MRFFACFAVPAKRHKLPVRLLNSMRPTDKRCHMYLVMSLMPNHPLSPSAHPRLEKQSQGQGVENPMTCTNPPTTVTQCKLR